MDSSKVSEPTKLKCNGCGHNGVLTDLLSAPNPFDAEETISGCPVCMSINRFDTVCYAAGCWSIAGDGRPHPDGVYRWSCHRHIPRQAD
jgi:hypothetical protein